MSQEIINSVIKDIIYKSDNLNEITINNIAKRYDLKMTKARELLTQLAGMGVLDHKQEQRYKIASLGTNEELKENISILTDLAPILMANIIEKHDLKWVSELNKYIFLFKTSLINIENSNIDELIDLDMITQDYWLFCIKQTSSNTRYKMYLSIKNNNVSPSRIFKKISNNKELREKFYKQKLSFIERSFECIVNKDKEGLLDTYLDSINHNINFIKED